MYLGKRLGQYLGDPLDLLRFERVSWTNPGETTVQAVWCATISPSRNVKFAIYQDGSRVSNEIVTGKQFTAATPGTLPKIVAVPYPKDLDEVNGLSIVSEWGWSAFDPLWSQFNNMSENESANVTTEKDRRVNHLRGRYRIAKDSLATYELYHSTSGVPDIDSASPVATNAVAPSFVYAVASGQSHYLLVVQRNKYNLVTRKRDATVFEIDGGGNEVNRPTGPINLRLTQKDDGKIRIQAEYYYLEDATSVRADEFAVWLTNDGSNPDPSVDPTLTTVSVVEADGLAKLDYTTGSQTDGATIKVIVRTRRTSDSVDDGNSDIVSATADATAPSTPVGNVRQGDIYLLDEGT